MKDGEGHKGKEKKREVAVKKLGHWICVYMVE